MLPHFFLTVLRWDGVAACLRQPMVPCHAADVQRGPSQKFPNIKDRSAAICTATTSSHMKLLDVTRQLLDGTR